ncbi:motility protein A [Limnochorda pilosa]|uniref:Flagellar motor protein MotP n=1 Tax=Limnochorda pilosa TaxID=1555112 RepID=A0A0K2SKG2_LIMPI|nr:motility protein A [Limnochorda pilosa]BAS27507.1 flagellar motor protein MotP [Limnochorda pilosa]
MDLTTILGILVGIGILGASVAAGSSIGSFVNWPSLGIVLGGTLASTLVHFPFRQVLSIVPLALVALRNRDHRARALIHDLVEFSKKARREGLLAMEQEAAEHPNDFLRKGIQLVVDGTEPDLVRSIMEIDLAAHEERHAIGQEVMQSMGAYAPAFGMIGTLIGLIQMLTRLDDPDAVGPGMAVALITTLYGVVLANLVFLPLAGKLRLRSQEERLEKELIVEGVLSIQAGENPRIVEEKLLAFLSPEERAAEIESRSQQGREAVTGDVS